MTVHPILANILSDLFVNLAAGWFGTVFIIPIASERPIKERFFILTVHFGLGIFCLLIAFEIRNYFHL